MSTEATDHGRGWRSSPFPPPDPSRLGVTLGDALLAVARERPSFTALIDKGRRIAFSELAGRIGALADHMRTASAPSGPVALLQSSGADAVAAWFAAAAAGRPLLLLEPRNPPERNRALVGKAGAPVMLCDRETCAHVPAGALAVLRAEDAPKARTLAEGEGLGVDAPALIFPTAGSTGEPKLIVYAHRTLQAKAQASIPLMGAAPAEVVMIAGSHANYGFMHHAMVFLLAGGSVCLHDMSAGGLPSLFDAILANGVRHVRFTPSLFRAAAEHPASHAALRQLRAARFSGEPFLPSDYELARRTLALGALIQNVYGSTESQLFIWSSERDPLPAGQSTTLGRIYPNAEFRICEEDGAPLEKGEAGELVISSRYQALGDYREGVVDEGRFPPDPRGEGRRLYFTGDVARVGDDGALVMLGRKDRVVKVNGHRVSLIEIENLLRAMPGCAQAAVLPRKSATGAALAAFLTAKAGAAPHPDPRAYLAGCLPDSMLPSSFLWIEEMPLLPGGKVDSESLLARLPQSAPVAGDAAEDDLSGLWLRALGIAGCRPNDSFFDLGGDSLKLLSLSLALETRFGRKLDVEAFVEEPSLAGLAKIYAIAAPSLGARRSGLSKPAFRLLSRPVGAPRGVALALPSLSGRAGEQIIRAGALGSFEVWGCDVDLPDGNLVQDLRWFESAERIAESLQRPDAPRPQVLFGFSFAGYAAWLVDRLLRRDLPGSRRLVCVDAPPLHRIPHYEREMARAGICVDPGPAAQMAHLRRIAPPGFNIPLHSAFWRDEDAALFLTPLRTVDHDEIGGRAALAVHRDLIDRFAAGDVPPDAVLREPRPLSTFGGKLFEMLAADGWPAAGEVEASARAFPEMSRPTTAAIMQFLVIGTLDLQSALRFCAELADRRPEIEAARYGVERLTAITTKGLGPPRPDLWPPKTASTVNLVAKSAVDYALTARLDGG